MSNDSGLKNIPLYIFLLMSQIVEEIFLILRAIFSGSHMRAIDMESYL